VRGFHALGLFVKNKTMLVKGRVLLEGFNFDQKVALRKELIPLGDFVLQDLRVERAFVNVKERHVIVKDFVQEDQEFDQVRVGLLPEWLLAAAKQVVEEGRDSKGGCVGVLVIVQRVIAVAASQVDFQVVLGAAVLFQDLSNLV